MSVIVTAAKLVAAVATIARVDVVPALQLWTGESLLGLVDCVGAPRVGALITAMVVIVGAAVVILDRARRGLTEP